MTEEFKVLGFSSTYSFLLTTSVVLIFLFLFSSFLLSCCWDSPNPQQIRLFDTCIDLLKVDAGMLFGLLSGKIVD